MIDLIDAIVVVAANEIQIEIDGVAGRCVSTTHPDVTAYRILQRTDLPRDQQIVKE